MTNPAVSDALLKISQIVGAEWLKSDDATRLRYARSTTSSGQVPLAIVLPETVTQVQEIVRIAGAHQLALYPISCGKNWGYGDASPPRPNQIVLDLGRMNRIVEVNETLAYTVIEPGVTQGQLHAYLRDHHPNLWMDTTGAGMKSSFVGNTLDRGFGHTRYGDHFSTTCSMEVVLADGRILRTGYGHYENARATRAYRYGIGPFLDGIFAQSNFGIVTQIGLWLMPRPQDFCAFFFSAQEHEQLGDLIERLAPLRMQGMLQSTIHIANDLRTISAKRRYPWDLTQGRTPLPADVRSTLRHDIGIGRWNGCGAIYGTTGMVAATRKALKKALAGYRLKFVDDRKLAFAHRVRRFMGMFGGGQKLGDLLETVAPVYDGLKGIPSDDPLKGAAWRVRGPNPGIPQEPLDCHVGLIWVSPVVPTTRHDAMEVLRLMEPIYEKHGFDALVTFTMITERAMCCVTNIAFDAREKEESERAAACYEELSGAIAAAGYLPYRTGPQGYAKLAQGSTVFWDVVGEIKRALDPQGIISPGRYEPK